MRYAVEKWKQRYWKVTLFDEEGNRVVEIASLYSRDGLYVNGTLSDARLGGLFVRLGYALADASAGGSTISTVREVVEDVLEGEAR